MGVLSRLPWWSAFPLSAGFGLISVFAPDALPQPIRIVLFWLGIALLVVGIGAASWHFRVRVWVARNVLWRLRLHEPAAANIAASTAHKLTQIDRERVARLISDVFDFIGAEVMPLQNTLVSAICGSDPPDLCALGPPLQDRHRALSRSAHALLQRHSHYLELVDLDLLPLLQDIASLGKPIADAFEARDWPKGAQQERANALNYAFSALGNTVEHIKIGLRDTRREMLDAG